MTAITEKQSLRRWLPELPLKEILQTIVITPGDESVIEEAMHLLEAYAEGPYEIFEKSMDKVPEEYRPTVLYLMNEDR